MKKIFLLIIIGCSIISCKSVLEIEPKSFVSERNAWKTENDVVSELHGSYALIRKAFTDSYRFWSYGDFRFGDLYHDQWSSYYNQQNLNTDFYAIEGQSAWTLFYTAIVQCNLIIEKSADLKDGDYLMYPREHYLAEAKFLRAFLYFYISRVWGDVPLQTLALNKDPLPREKMEKVLEFAKEDLAYAIKYLPWKHQFSEPQVRAVRATRGAAYTLLTHVHMWQRNYKDALVSSKAVMDSVQFSGYALLPFEKSDELFKGRSVEGIFEIDLDETWQESSNATLANLTLFKRPWVPTDRTSSYATIKTDTLANLYTANDKRKLNWFQDQSTTTPMVLKFKNIVASRTGFSDDNIIVFRFADLLLLRAEALEKQGLSGEAEMLLNKVRERSDAPLFDGNTEKLADALIKERRRELIGEGHIWFDMIRTGYLLKFKPTLFSESEMEMGAWTFPVNKYSFITNGLLEQTPYWL